MQMPSWSPLAVCTVSLRPPLASQKAEAGFSSAGAGLGAAATAARIGRTSAASVTPGNAALLLLEHVLGDQRGGHRGRPAGVEGEMGDDLAQLGLGHAVVQRAFEVAGQLLL